MTLEDAIKNREDCLKYLEGLGQKASPQNVEAVRWSVRALKFMQSLTLTPPNEWVSVEERLPEGNGEYIVTACDEGCPAGEGIWYDTVVVFAEYYDGCWTWNDGTEYDLTDIVTHWMPLPAPPNRRPPEGEEDA